MCKENVNLKIKEAIAKSQHQNEIKEKYNMNRKKEYVKKVKLTPSAQDALNYEKAYDEETKYIVCAVCRTHGSVIMSFPAGDIEYSLRFSSIGFIRILCYSLCTLCSIGI
jgi:hypothetical protein